YCGSYVIRDLEQCRLSVARLSSFNDPFELYLTAGKRLSRTGARKVLRSRMQREEFWSMAERQLPGRSRKQLQRIVNSMRGHLISRHVENQQHLSEFHRSHPWKTMERYVRFMCFTEPKENDPAEVPMWGYYGARHEGVRIHFRKEFCEQAT